LSESLEARLASNNGIRLKSNQHVLDFVSQFKQESGDDVHSKLAIFGFAFGNRALFYESLTAIQAKAKVEALLRPLSNCSESYYRSIVSYFDGQETN
jgi:hypothetical protein